MAQQLIAPWAELAPDAPYPMTAEELERLPDDGWHYELVRGRLVRMPPPGGAHGKIVVRLSAKLLSFVEQQQIGHVLAGEAGFYLRLPSEPKETELGADVAFVQGSRAPKENSPAWSKPWRLAPDLVAEVASPDQHRPDMAEKAQLWLTGGVRLVWILWPRWKQIDVWVPGQEGPVQSLKADETVAGRDVLPGFSCQVAEIFR